MRRKRLARLVCLAVWLALWIPVAGRAADDDRLVRLHAAEPLVETGLMRYILPRFSLKTQVRVELVAPDAAPDLVLGPQEGKALFQGAGGVWRLKVLRAGHPGTEKLVAWLTSEVGQRTIFSFAPEGEPLFAPPPEETAKIVAVAPSGDVALGRAVSREKCGRCHVVSRDSALGGIGSTPSFFALRALPDWRERFSTFYVRNPHPAFTQIEGLTPAFPEERPVHIHPVNLALEEVEAILAYVAELEPADLGAPVKHQ